MFGLVGSALGEFLDSLTFLAVARFQLGKLSDSIADSRIVSSLDSPNRKRALGICRFGRWVSFWVR